MREQYGERETVSRAAQRIIRSFIDWGVLRESEEQGIYQQGETIQISDLLTIGWLMKALLISCNQQQSAIKILLDSPTLFPFQFAQINAEQLARISGLELIRHGLDDEMVALR